jgi:hypothetical protein
MNAAFLVVPVWKEHNDCNHDCPLGTLNGWHPWAWSWLTRYDGNNPSRVQSITMWEDR